MQNIYQHLSTLPLLSGIVNISINLMLHVDLCYDTTELDKLMVIACTSINPRKNKLHLSTIIDNDQL